MPIYTRPKIGLRGRPSLYLDLARIKALASQGLGCWAIARRLSEDMGLPVSPQTVRRRLAGQGVLL